MKERKKRFADRRSSSSQDAPLTLFTVPPAAIFFSTSACRAVAYTYKTVISALQYSFCSPA
ncbi:hypothetical protein BCV70DRAFT_199811, partial [Testicularia cyperi]